jgi:hypothetical protein
MFSFICISGSLAVFSTYELELKTFIRGQSVNVLAVASSSTFQALDLD